MEKEVFCRNDLMNYFAWVNHAEEVYAALAAIPAFRKELNSQCHSTLKLMEDNETWDLKYKPKDKVDDLL